MVIVHLGEAYEIDYISYNNGIVTHVTPFCFLNAVFEYCLVYSRVHYTTENYNIYANALTMSTGRIEPLPD